MDAIDELIQSWADGYRIIYALYGGKAAQALQANALRAGAIETPFAEDHARALVSGMHARAKSKAQFGMIAARDLLRSLATMCEDPECAQQFAAFFRWRELLRNGVRAGYHANEKSDRGIDDGD